MLIHRWRRILSRVAVVLDGGGGLRGKMRGRDRDAGFEGGIGRDM
jgi:hypothetical protein